MKKAIKRMPTSPLTFCPYQSVSHAESVSCVGGSVDTTPRHDSTSPVRAPIHPTANAACTLRAAIPTKVLSRPSHRRLLRHVLVLLDGRRRRGGRRLWCHRRRLGHRALQVVEVVCAAPTSRHDWFDHRRRQRQELALGPPALTKTRTKTTAQVPRPRT